MEDTKTLEVEIITPQKVAFSGKAQSVSLPGSKSPFQVLYNHAPIVSSLDIGLIRVDSPEGVQQFFAASEGFAEVQKNHISILVETAVTAADIDVEKVKAEMNEAKNTLKHTKDADETTKLKNKIKLSEICLQAAQHK